MNKQEIKKIFEKMGAVISDSHIVYTSDKHGSAYINKDAVYTNTHEISKLCKEIATHFANTDVEAVVAPALGGIILSQWTAHHLSEITGKEIISVYAEKTEDKNFVIKRGYDKLIQGKKVLLLEDVLTTGGSLKKVVEIVKNIGSPIVGAGVLCNRGGISAPELGVPEVFSLLEINLQAWEETDCPLCKQNVPINTNVGKGREYLANKR
ncbi:phosphoribosyltransferase [bacterium]|nr:phosphoribosyltransferase [bacterium]MBT3581183.1 phosphoribosyltransferase [bacterium]